MKDTQELALEDENVIKAIERGFIEITKDKIIYSLKQKQAHNWKDPEEWVRARTVAFLIIDKGYPANRILTEVKVPRRTPNDYADIVVYRDDKCKDPYLVVENKPAGQNQKDRNQAIEQAFGNANSLRVSLTLYDEFFKSFLYDVDNYPAQEREENKIGSRDLLPEQYGNAPEFTYIAGGEKDIRAVKSSMLENKIRKAHSIIWAGGRRDPLTAFDEWSKLLFAKVIDERTTETGDPRRFQVGSSETTASVSNRIHKLFEQGAKDDPSIFPNETRISLPDKKIYDVVSTIQDVSFTRTDVDSVGAAFENFFGSVFRGELGQYFTMRQLARFTVAVLDIKHSDFVIDPTAGSGGFLLEALLQVWHNIDEKFKSQPSNEIERIKSDFALHRVYGIEIHEILARICKINLLLHHDGHTNIEGDKSCLDISFSKSRLNPPTEKFSIIIGNPPFGDTVEEGDEDHLGENSLSNFITAEGRGKVASEHVILERAVELLEPDGRLGLIIPDGLLNNQGELSNCPRMRNYLAKHGYFEAIISLPDYAFRKSGAQNKTSILFFRKFNRADKKKFDLLFATGSDENVSDDLAILQAVEGMNDYSIFLAEANQIGYSTTGAATLNNELYSAEANGRLSKSQTDTILGEYQTFIKNKATYLGRELPDCMSIKFTDLWKAHSSRRLDPKYFLFKREEQSIVPENWIKLPLKMVLEKREEIVHQELNPNEKVTVLTIAQTGELRLREAGKGRNPPEWLGMYFEDSPSTWFKTRENDVVFSSIDLWKGCLSIVPKEFEGALVTKEFPIYKLIDRRLDPTFLSYLLRSRYYQRAFRAITTGHSNRRRTQVGDFEELEICFPPDKKVQRKIISDLKKARVQIKGAEKIFKEKFVMFNNLIDNRGNEELPEVDGDINEE